MSYRDTYQSWLDSAVLSQEEKAELTAIQNDEKEIESRFFEQLSFG
ncbi:phosphomannomutase, partial [Klebsiella oxytoca]